MQNSKITFPSSFFFCCYCCCSVTKSCPTLWDPMECSTPDSPILHHHLEFAEIHVYWVGDAIQPPHPHPLLLPSIFPSIRFFSMSCLFTLSGQSIGDSASASVLPSNIQDWLALGWTALISFLSKGLTTVFATIWKHQFISTQPSLWSSSHQYMTTGKIIVLTDRLVSKLMSLLFNTLSRFVIAFLPRSKHILISRLQSPSTVILEPRKIKSVTVFTFSHLFTVKWWDQTPWSVF